MFQKPKTKYYCKPNSKIFASFIGLLLSLNLSFTQSATLLTGGEAIDESLVTVKNNRLIFNGISENQLVQGYSIVGITFGALQGKAEIVNDYQIAYHPGLNICDESDRFSYLVSDGTFESVKEVTIEILCESIAIMSSMSPNGDGKQDSFVILGVDNYPNNELVIFNDLGHEIYRQINYANNWNGQYNGHSLPYGVYYYVFKPGNGETISGYLYVGQAS
ncbi:MAG: gliding motility-associated C-terminal domain-containing protein [Bacteroidia bacterium]|nr:gliding motility-associated C-terminal domain-containing protein [Bacteroidia bacterium]